MTKVMQEIQNEFLEKFPELKEFPALAMEMQSFLHKSCIRYAEGIVPEIAEKFGSQVDYDTEWYLGYNECRLDMQEKLQEDSQSPIS